MLGVEERAAFGINWSAVAELMGGRIDKRGAMNFIEYHSAGAQFHDFTGHDFILDATSLCALVREGFEAHCTRALVREGRRRSAVAERP